MRHVGLSSLIFFAVGAITLLIWWYWASHPAEIAGWWLQGRPLKNADSWGNSFGAFNALFGALGFAALVATLLVQASALRMQQRDQRRQRFDTTFFELLKLMRELGAEVRFQYSSEYRKSKSKGSKPISATVLTGHHAVRAAVLEMRYWLSEGKASARQLDQVSLSRIYTDRVHRRYESRLGPYFRLIYTILNRIKMESALTAEDRVSYGNILRSQLSSYELALIAMNALAPVAKDLADLVTEFRLLKYLPHGTMRRVLEPVYNPTAFEARD